MAEVGRQVLPPVQFPVPPVAAVASPFASQKRLMAEAHGVEKWENSAPQKMVAVREERNWNGIFGFMALLDSWRFEMIAGKVTENRSLGAFFQFILIRH